MGNVSRCESLFESSSLTDHPQSLIQLLLRSNDKPAYWAYLHLLISHLAADSASNGYLVSHVNFKWPTTGTLNPSWRWITVQSGSLGRRLFLHSGHLSCILGIERRFTIIRTLVHNTELCRSNQPRGGDTRQRVRPWMRANQATLESSICYSLSKESLEQSEAEMVHNFHENSISRSISIRSVDRFPLFQVHYQVIQVHYQVIDISMILYPLDRWFLVRFLYRRSTSDIGSGLICEWSSKTGSSRLQIVLATKTTTTTTTRTSQAIHWNMYICQSGTNELQTPFIFAYSFGHRATNKKRIIITSIRISIRSRRRYEWYTLLSWKIQFRARYGGHANRATTRERVDLSCIMIIMHLQ